MSSCVEGEAEQREPMSPETTGVAGGGGGRRRRVQPWRSIHPVSNDSADNHPDAGNSEWNSMSSDHDVLNFPRRNKALDDALFGFFSKQAVKSLKRNFSRFYEDSSFRHKGKKSKVDGAGRHVFSRFSVKYYHEVMKNLTPYQRAVIQKFRCKSLVTGSWR